MTKLRSTLKNPVVFYGVLPLVITLIYWTGYSLYYGELISKGHFVLVLVASYLMGPMVEYQESGSNRVGRWLHQKLEFSLNYIVSRIMPVSFVAAILAVLNGLMSQQRIDINLSNPETQSILFLSGILVVFLDIIKIVFRQRKVMVCSNCGHKNIS